MDTVDLDYAKAHLEDLAARAAVGEDVRIIVSHGCVVKLVPASSSPARQHIIFGQWKHLVEIPEERLLAPLTDDELAWLSGANSTVE